MITTKTTKMTKMTKTLNHLKIKWRRVNVKAVELKPTKTREWSRNCCTRSRTTWPGWTPWKSIVNRCSRTYTRSINSRKRETWSTLLATTRNSTPTRTRATPTRTKSKSTRETFCRSRSKTSGICQCASWSKAPCANGSNSRSPKTKRKCSQKTRKPSLRRPRVRSTTSIKTILSNTAGSAISSAPKTVTISVLSSMLMISQLKNSDKT